MSRLWIQAIFLIFPAFCFAAPVPQGPMTVIIDAGHGGKDRGTTRRGIYESDITLEVAKALYERLKSDRNFRPILSRDNQHGVSLAERARLAKQHHASLLLSIHVNSSPDAKARGAEFYFQNQLQSDEESMFLAHKENAGEAGPALTYQFLDKNRYPADVSSIVTDLLDSERVWRSASMAKALKTSWKGSHKKFNSNSIRQAPFFLLSQISTPSALVELGFLTNSEDFEDLTNPAKLSAMADDLYRGIRAYKDSIDKPRRSP
jgi:N-acetylmuramoyl-L-alanine amidase